jgi:L-ascorbate metabolism protein UlaG (beta-lactamase superfamily)
MHKEGVPEDQLLVVGGGEKVRLSDRVTVRVFPSLHACTWARTGGVEEECLGDMGLTLQERHERMAAVGLGPSGQFEHGKPSRHTGGESDDRPGIAELRAHLRESDQQPRGDGGALAYLIETPEGSVLWKDTSGHWTGILRDLRPDVAILGAGGRGNIDGEPVQGSLAQFLAREVDLLRPGRVVLCHHDNWMPPVTSETDVEPIRAELARNFPQVVQVEMGYMEDYPILRGD